MIERARLKEMLDARELSQSELARRVGITQATIYKLLAGEIYGTKHLHRIARELGTTPAYLSGETDDPTADAPAAPELDSAERELVDVYRSMTPRDRDLLLNVARSMNGTPMPSTQIHERRQEFAGEDRR